MQLQDTRVTPEGQMMTVEFVGQGGELVSIVMDNSDNKIESGNAVEHAKAIMVQLSSFGTEDPDREVGYDNRENLDSRDDQQDSTEESTRGSDIGNGLKDLDEGPDDTNEASGPVSATAVRFPGRET